ncbi:hypothetical protein AArcSl_1925 [Halalkaliarchaeum desulfuricum]|uniref:Glutamate--cysteine ligase n=1 Tax=Halalkaliarchaeum desulfuricum TaxID=2055893 RepID=A0A343TKC8_9EURY|nr:hypothetical protein [Halalkaliarchaeum desulfuricum]AUX09550.1 hypothetical protein AArcSl_1925 [Halalkaliarchaeum desulfuricum]
MTPDEYAAAVHDSLAPETRSAFAERVETQADAVTADLIDGRLDNADFAVGLELEAYVTASDGTLARVPTELFGADGTNPELGVHNLELNTVPDVLDGPGLRRQARRLRELVSNAREQLPSDRRLALDAMWTVPPTEGTRQYLAAGTEHDGVFLSQNMHADARYYALDNEVRNRADGEIELSVPGVDLTGPSILIESLTASIQPHLQVPDASTFPRYHDLAIRTLGPVLSLASNSPFLPADCYRPIEAPSEVERLLSAAPHEHRIPVFEDAINAGLPGDKQKVRVPNDLESLEQLPARVVADVTYAPHLYDDIPAASAATDEQSIPYADRIPEYRHKRGTYWRWVRGVVGGDVPTGADGVPTGPGNDTASLRLEYRPLPTQPTVRDSVAFQALVVGLLRGLVIEDHPLGELPWKDAKDAFYAAVDDGPEAALSWVAADGTYIENRERIRQELLEYARRGLAASGTDGTTVDWLLEPVEARVRAGTTPSSWQRDRVLSRVRDGATLPAAIRETKRAYLDCAASTESFADWL